MISIDDRAGSVEMLELFHSRGIPVRKERLAAGDASLTGNGPDGPARIGFERKAIPDLVNSMTSGRMAEQLPKLLREFDFVWVIVEGRWRPSPHSGELQVARHRGKLNTSDEFKDYSEMFPQMVRTVEFKAVDKFLISLAMKARVFVWKTETMDETVQFIADSRSWFMDPWDSHKSHLAFHNPREEADSALLTPPGLVRRIAAQLPYIGWDKSKHVSQQFESVYDMVNAEEDEWKSIAGIGKTIASKVWRVLRGLS